MGTGMVRDAHRAVASPPSRPREHRLVSTDAGLAPGRLLAHVVPTRRGTLPRHGPVVRKEIACHVCVALWRANIIAEFLCLLPPDDGINLKEPGVMAIPCAAQDLPVPGPVLALAFALGDPLQHGRQGLILHNDNPGLLHHLRDDMVRSLRWHGRAEDSSDHEQQTTQHEGHHAACAP